MTGSSGPGMGRHWIAGIAQSAGIPNAAGLTIAVKTAAGEAWREVLKTCPVTDEDLARHVANHFRLAVADLAAAEAKAIKLIPEKVARRYQVFPLREDDRHIVVATGDPLNVESEQMVGFSSGRKPVFEVAPPAKIADAIDAQFSTSSAVENLARRLDPELSEAVRVVQEVQRGEALDQSEAETAPVVKLTNLILRDAVKSGASDIHIEPGRENGMVRFRIDGVLRLYMQMPMQALDRVVSRIKILARLDISERHRPQDGRTRIQTEGRNFDLRISTVPTRDSEKAVLRILDPAKVQRLENLSISSEELRRFRHLLSFREGIVVVTGPTGSGKTTTLYAGIRELHTGEVNISTVEDPVEYELAGIAQIQVDPIRSVTFASALRALLRQDPDVIFIGEIRDAETAEIAVQASMTGHLVLATLHTNDAVGVIARLADLGLQRTSIADTLRGVLSQRLIRRVCLKCSQRVDGRLNDHERRLAALYNVVPRVRAVGCEECSQTGYRGRMLIAEVIVADPNFKALVSRGAIAAELQPAAVAEGMRPIREVAMERVISGETTLDEVERVLGEIETPTQAPTPQKQSILLVDDDPVLRRIARRLLEENGFHVDDAEDGRVALERLTGDSKYGLVVLDLDMPQVGGREVLRSLRGSTSTASLPVVVLTGTNQAEAEIELMEQGADDYIRKPIDPPRFLARVKAALRRAAA